MTQQVASSGGRKNKQLLWIIAIAALTTIVPYIMYYTGIGIPSGTINQGILVAAPIELSDFTFRSENMERWDLAEQAPKFRLVIPVLGTCEELCLDSLYVTRQVHIRLSDKKDQVERLYVQLGEADDDAFRQFLAAEHPNLTYLEGDYREWRAALGDQPELSAGFDGAEYYLLHRYGALVMAYNEDHHGNQLLDDLEFLIKTSN
ncbi:MAG: hypothetical protein WDZ30_11405 [Cellvibrionaceae bacterium]